MPIFNASEIKKHRLVQLNEGEDVLRIKTDSAQGVVVYGPDGKPTSFTADLRTPNSLYGTTARIDLGSITIPPEVCLPGAYIKGWAMFSGSKDALSKTHLVSVNEAGGGMYGATDIFNAALTTTNYSGNRVEFYLRILNEDTIVGGTYGSGSGLGATGSAVTTNPITVPVNTRGGGLDIAFGGNVAAAPTAAVDVSNASPAVVTHTAHGKFVGQLVSFAAAPAGLTSARPYFVSRVIDANRYAISETKGGPEVGTTASATGITATYYTVLTLEDAHIEVSL